ncbi:MAG TPA: hypothetical protein VF395_13195 [Polyangiaceae bacterium]
MTSFDCPYRRREFHCAALLSVAGALSALGSLTACTALVDRGRTFGRTSSAAGDAGPFLDGGNPNRAAVDGRGRGQPAYEQIAFLKCDTPERLGVFGYPVLLSGEDVLVGSAGASISRFAHAGKGYLIEPTGGSWRNITGVGSPHPEGDGGVPDVLLPTLAIRPPGISMAISGDTLVLGVAGENVEQNGASLEDAGAAYVFERQAGIFQVVQRLTSSSPRARATFGLVVALDGDTLAVGAPWDDGPNAADGTPSVVDSGAVYVFRRTGALFESPTVVRPAVFGAGDLFGGALALQGNLLVVGDAGEAGTGSGSSADPRARGPQNGGAVYTFVRNGASDAWTQDQYLKPVGASTAQFFGASVALNGRTLVVGAPTVGRLGSVHTYDRTSGSFVPSGPVLSPPGVTNGAELFGFSVAVSSDVLVVGTPGDLGTARGVAGDPAVVDPSVAASGAAHVYFRRGQTWEHAAYLKASNADSADLFGLSVAATDSLVLVGAPGESSSGPLASPEPDDNGTVWAGAAYLFRRSGP